MWKAVLLVFAAVLAVGSGTLVGGLVEADFDEGARRALDFAVAEHNKRENEMTGEPLNVVGVKRQIVSGVKYEITVTMGKTNCRNGSPNQSCIVRQDQNYRCTFTVLVVPWLHTIKVMSYTCDGNNEGNLV